MGHLVNPISFRLSVNSFWSSNWVLLNNFNYINIFKKDYLLFNYFDWLFNKSEIWTKNFLYSGYKIYRMYKKIIVNIYYYDAEAQIPQYGKLRFYAFVVRYLVRKLWFPPRTQKLRNKIVRRRTWKLIIIFLQNKFIKAESFWLKNKFQYFHVNAVNKNNNYDNISLNFYSTDNLSIPVTAIASYIGFRLRRKYSLGWVLRPVLKDLNSKIRKKRILGYKILCSGRFTRHQIATYRWHHRGAIRYSTATSSVHYAEVRVRLKFGLGGIKVWLGFGKNDIDLMKRRVFIDAPKYLPFKYSIRVFRNDKRNYIILHLNYWFFFFIRVLFFKTRQFNMYKYCLRARVKFLLYFLIRKGRRSFVSIFNAVKFVYREKHSWVFYESDYFFELKRRIWEMDFRIKRMLKNEKAKKHIRELSLMFWNIEKYKWIQANKNKEWYKAAEARKLKKRFKEIQIQRIAFVKDLAKTAIETRRLGYLESFIKIIPFFNLILVKDSKLIITFKHNKYHYSLYSNSNLISSLLEQNLSKKFII